MKRVIERSARKAVLGALCALGALALAFPPALLAFSQKSALNVGIGIQGIARITDLAAAAGLTPATINLTWTEPGRSLTTAPHSYVVRVSTVGQITDEVDFSTAQPLSVFSPSAPPAPGSGGAKVAFVVAGLNPLTTYYFAIHEVDSALPQHVGVWIRDVSRNWNPNNSARPLFSPSQPDAITDLTALPGTLEGDVDLAWTAPRNQNGIPMASYTLHFATFSVASLAGDTTAWFNLTASSSVTVSPASAPGSLVSRTINSLYPATTWYFGIKSADILAEVSPIDSRAAGSQAQTLPRDFPPATPSGLGGAAGFLSATLSWNDLTPAQKGLDFGFYKLYRSTDDVTFNVVASTAALSFVDRPLTPYASYYYRISARDFGGFESALSSSVVVVPFALPPMEPLGVKAVAGPTTVTLSWSTTTRFGDGTPFVSTAAPTIDELQGYSIRRSTALCTASPVYIATNTATQATYTDVTGGAPYFYEIRSYNTTGASTATLVVSSLGDQHFFLDDCSSRIQLTAVQADMLRGASNGMGGDVRLSRQRRPQDTVGQKTIIQSAEWLPMLDGVTELRNFHLPSPTQIVLHFLVSGGSPVPQAAAVASLEPETGAAAAADMKNLGMFWNNGSEFKKMYGLVDPLSQTVAVASPNLGLYQVRTLLRSNGAVFDLSNVSSRVITPNGDGLNDLFIVTYDPGPNNVQPEGAVYDLRGLRVGGMRPGLVPNTLVWDGRMNGAPVTSGVYVYQIKGDGKTFNGTIVVAR